MTDAVHAAFVLAWAGGGIAATTRPGEPGRFGLPGGKLLPGETAEAAAVREALEEGWRVFGPLAEVHWAHVEGRPVVWLAAERAEILPAGTHAEAGRVEPVAATLAEIAAGGFRNADALQAWVEHLAAEGAVRELERAART